MTARFISENIQPEAGTIPPGPMIQGEPAFPERFIWRKQSYQLEEILETWKETGPCTHGSAERYVRKHWFRIRTVCGEEMKIYFERKPRSKADKKRRWWLHTIL
jgi:hypothetical protein